MTVYRYDGEFDHRALDAELKAAGLRVTGITVSESALEVMAELDSNGQLTLDAVVAAHSLDGLAKARSLKISEIRRKTLQLLSDGVDGVGAREENLAYYRALLGSVEDRPSLLPLTIMAMAGTKQITVLQDIRDIVEAIEDRQKDLLDQESALVADVTAATTEAELDAIEDGRV